jgi:acetolactate synthase I/II/III large subunit
MRAWPKNRRALCCILARPGQRSRESAQCQPGEVPIVNLVGQHATDHLHTTRRLLPISKASRGPTRSGCGLLSLHLEVGRDAAEAVVAARTAPGQIATLDRSRRCRVERRVELDCPISACRSLPACNAEPSSRPQRCFASSLRTAILISRKRALRQGPGHRRAHRGCHRSAKLLAPYPITRLQRGAGMPRVERVQYVLEQGIEQFKEFRQLILVGTQAPVAYFAYPGKSSVFTAPECEIHTLAKPGEDYVGALDALAAALSIRGTDEPTAEKSRTAFAAERRNHAARPWLRQWERFFARKRHRGRRVDDLGPRTDGRTKGAPPHDWLGNTGGSIGIAMPLAVGAAVACPIAASCA